MKFEDLFREKYRIALNAARSGNVEETIAGLKGIYQLLREQYERKNEDTIMEKSHLLNECRVFAKYIHIAQESGLKDERLQELFGLNRVINTPSMDPLTKKVSDTPSSDFEIDIEGLNEEPKEEVKEEPVEETPKEDDVVIEEPITEDEETSKEEIPQGGVDKEGNPLSLADFIGQQKIVKTLLKEIAIAKNEGRKHIDNILLFGRPGLGKTTLMALIAKGLGVHFEKLDCTNVDANGLQNFLMKVARENEPVVIALDEIHALSDSVQESLLTLLNDRVYVSSPDKNGNVVRIPIEEFTFIAATTDDNKVKPTIKDRCLRLQFRMVEYTPEELKQIYKTKVTAMGLTIDDDAIDTCIPRSRGSMREVGAIIKGLNIALYDDNGVRLSTHIDKNVALDFFKEQGIDEMGLKEKDYEILYALKETKNHILSLDTLAARVGLDSKIYVSDYEPFLIKVGFIDVSSRGRMLTEKAMEYLNK